MTPLRIRARLRSALTILAGEPPDHMDERIRAENAARTNLSLLEQVREQLATAEQDRDYLRERVNDLNEMLEDKDDAATTAFNAIAAACGCAHWYYPGQVVRDVRAVIKERDEAVALISTLRAEFEAYKSDAASGAKEADRLRVALADVTRDRNHIHAKQQEDARILVLLWEWTHDGGNQYVPTGGDADTFGDGVRRAQDRVQNILATRRQVAEPPPTPKRKRTKEERWERERKTLALMWGRHYGAAHDIREAMTRIGRPATSREVIKEVEREYVGAGFSRDHYIDQGMRLVSDLARAGYLTVAKGPGGVRVYGLKETPE